MRQRKTGSDDSAFMLSYRQAAARYNLGLTSVQRIAKDCGAVRHFGKTARVVISIMDEYVLSLGEK